MPQYLPFKILSMPSHTKFIEYSPEFSVERNDGCVVRMQGPQKQCGHFDGLSIVEAASVYQ